MMDWLQKLTTWYFSREALPYWGILLIDCFTVLLSALISIYLCGGDKPLALFFWQWVGFWCAMLPAYIVFMRLFHTYSGIFRYSSFIDLGRVAYAIILGSILVRFIDAILPVTIFTVYPPIRVYLCLTFIAVILMWTTRVMVKILYDVAYNTIDAKRVFIFGIHQGGVAIAKSMRNEHPSRNIVKGFVTAGESLENKYLLGVRIYPPTADIVKVMIGARVNTLFVSPLYTEQFRENEEFVNALMKAGIKIMMMPEAEAWDGKSDLSHTQLREVEIEDLLPRDKIEVDMKAIGEMLSNKCILITGAAGSIGSEMVRQVAKYNPSNLLLIDQAETPMHNVRLYMERHYPHIPCQTVVGNISNATHMEELFDTYRPEYVFHAAAYKHVPMMEDNPAMAIQNNVYGTRVIADLAVKHGTKKFVMISTDKAVNPTNVMGCSKRICEIYCQSLNMAINDKTAVSINPNLISKEGKEPSCQFITTRFGNVLGSNGSVIPIFKEQISKGGPITVTHPDIIRFFMLIPEACQLVLNAGTMGHGGEIFVFDMGKPVRIVELAQRMISLSGAKNIEIKYTGLRDGEKLYEEVLNDAEQTKPTVHPKIKVASVREYPYDLALANEQELHKLSFTYDDMAIVKKMKEIVPEYKSQHSKYEVLD